MSWRAYETLTVQPNFSTPPEVGIVGSGRTLIDFAPAPAWATWHGDTPLSFMVLYRLEGPAETRTFREFINRQAGRSGSFFLPSWLPDYRLTADVAPGDVQIRIRNAGLSLITENRPDTFGRQIFILTPDGQFQAFGIISATVDGLDEILVLDAPAAFATTAANSIVGRLFLVRLADDRTEYSFQLPGHGDVQITAVTARQTRHVEDQLAITGAAVHGLRPFVDVLSYDQNPILYTFLSPITKGPISYGATPSVNYQTEWHGEVDGIEFRMTNTTTGDVRVSELYSAIQTGHITFAFDPGGREYVAWTTNEDRIQMRYWNSGSAFFREFDGFAPVAFNTYEIDSTASPATSDPVLFYLKRGYSGIFARFYRENFLTEHLVARSPTAPIYLQFVEAVGSKIEVVGMDAGHRLSRWRAGDYVPPMEAQMVFGSVEYIDGTYEATTTIVMEYEEVSGLVETTIDGAYTEPRIPLQITLLGSGLIETTIDGSYGEVRVPTSITMGASGTIATAVDGVYSLHARPAAVTETGEGRIETTIDGTYGL